LKAAIEVIGSPLTEEDLFWGNGSAQADQLRVLPL
jgi:hypothetical protein